MPAKLYMKVPALGIDPDSTEEFKKLYEENQNDKLVRVARWNSAKEEFIERCITGRQVHFPTLAAKYGLRYQTMRNKCSAEGWHKEVTKRAKEREDMLDKRLLERTQIALANLNEDFATSEEAIRKRHALFARSLQEKAIEGIRTRPLSDFKAADLLKMLELGITEERRAMGMKDTAELPAPPDEHEVIRQGYKSIFEQLGGHQKVQAIGTLLLRELSKKHPGIVDVNAVLQIEDAVQSVAPIYEPVPEAKSKPKFTITVGPKGYPNLEDCKAAQATG